MADISTFAKADDDRECYIPMSPPTPEQIARSVSIWRQVADRLGVEFPPSEANGEDDG